MKKLDTYINEKLNIGSDDTYAKYNYFPETKEELQELIKERIEKDGPKCDLNDIYTGDITDMSELFNAYNNITFKKFNGNISEWDVRNVENMDRMFYECEEFNCDISNWSVGEVISMGFMFYNCQNFNQDLSKCAATAKHFFHILYFFYLPL